MTNENNDLGLNEIQLIEARKVRRWARDFALKQRLKRFHKSMGHGYAQSILEDI